MDRLQTGERIAGLCGLALLVVLFLGWWAAGPGHSAAAVDLGLAPMDTDVTLNAFEADEYLDVLWSLTAASGLVIAAAALMGIAPGMRWAELTAALGAASVVTIAFRVLDPPLDASPRYGVFLGLIAAAGVAYGGWRAMQAE